MSKLPSFLRTLYSKPLHRCLLLGVGDAGKTALLYRMLLNEFVTSIPTIGFNCEDIPTGRATLQFWDIGGGCGRINPLIRHYTQQPGSNILFLVDTAACISDPEMLSWTLGELAQQAQDSRDCGMGFFGVAFGKQDRLESVLDSRVAVLEKRIRAAMETVYGSGKEGTRWGLYRNEEGGGISAVTGAGLSDGWLAREFLKGIKAGLEEGKKSDSRPPVTSPPAPAPQKGPLDESQLRALIEEQNGDDLHVNLTTAEFFEKMESGMLDKWDHRAHLRAGYYVLIENLWVGHGLWEAAEDFLGKLEKMLASDSKLAEIEGREKKFRNTVHRTMTTFYLHMIHISLLDFTTQNPSNLPKPTDFPKFLLSNPHLMSSQLWSTYYTKDTLFSPTAKSAWVLPDLKPLPTYISSAISDSELKKNISATPSHLTETERLQRFAFTVLKHVKATNQRRGKVIKDSLSALQKHIMQQRSNSISLEPYSETKAYFWIQILHASIDSLGGAKVIDITTLSFPSFVLLFPELLRRYDKGKEVWRSYYTEKSWESVEARMGLVLPTLRPLPNVIVPPTAKEREAAVRKELDVRIVGRRNGLSDVEMMLYEFWVVSEVREADDVGRPPHTHGGLLWRIFSALWYAKQEKRGMRDALNEILVADVRGKEPERRLGFTEKAFWARVVLKRFLEFELVKPGDVGGGDPRGAVLMNFQSFLAKNKELVLEDMWQGYYSAETWHSEDAVVRFVPPDLKETENFM